MVGCVHRQLPLCLGGRERLWKFGSAQPEGEPKETEDKEKQCSPFQRRWRGWVETRVSCLQNGRSGSLSGRSRLWNLLLLVSDVKFGGRLCGERGVIVVVHRRCRRQLQQFARKTDQSVTHPGYGPFQGGHEISSIAQTSPLTSLCCRTGGFWSSCYPCLIPTNSRLLSIPSKYMPH